MKRAIYVGKPWGDLRYGSTGAITDIVWEEAGDKICFVADGLTTRYWTDRDDLYIPSEDQTHHCPKPP